MKPCPFCKSETDQELDTFHSGTEGHTNGIVCMNCGARGPVTIEEYMFNLAESQREWNTRPIEAELLAALEGLVKIVCEDVCQDSACALACPAIESTINLILKHKEQS